MSSASALRMLARWGAESISTPCRFCTEPAKATFSAIHVQQHTRLPRSGVCVSEPDLAMIDARSAATAERSAAYDSGARPLLERAWFTIVSRLLASADASTSEPAVRHA